MNYSRQDFRYRYLYNYLRILPRIVIHYFTAIKFSMKYVRVLRGLKEICLILEFVYVDADMAKKGVDCVKIIQSFYAMMEDMIEKILVYQ